MRAGTISSSQIVHRSFGRGLFRKRNTPLPQDDKLVVENKNGSRLPGAIPKTWCTALCLFQYRKGAAESQVTWGSMSALSPQNGLLIKPENGPGGIRTRICGFGRALCCRYTTGPGCS